MKHSDSVSVRDVYRGVLQRTAAGLRDDDRGDVPGWVLVTLMTAGLVVAIWALAGPALAQLFEQAVSRVAGF
jgi:hypothetical protein